MLQIIRLASPDDAVCFFADAVHVEQVRERVGPKISLSIRYQDLVSRDAGEPSELIRQRVNNARTVQLHRFQKRPLHANAQMGARDIKRYCAVNDDGERLLETAINKLGLSARA